MNPVSFVVFPREKLSPKTQIRRTGCKSDANPMQIRCESHAHHYAKGEEEDAEEEEEEEFEARKSFTTNPIQPDSGWIEW